MEDEDAWEDEEELLDNATLCPSCDEMTAHEILKEKGRERRRLQSSMPNLSSSPYR